MTKLRTYTYPTINIPFECKVRPDFNEINEEVTKWMQRFKLDEILKQQLKQEFLVKSACYGYPDADFSRCVLTAKMCILIFVLDDTAGKRGHFFESLMKYENNYENLDEVMENAKHDKESYIALSFAECWEEMKAFSTKDWRNRFAGILILYLRSFRWEEKNNETHHIPHLAEYIEYRHYTVGMTVCIILIEYALNAFIPNYVFVFPTLQRLIHIANNFIAYTNDIYSFEKERKAGDLNNIIIVMKSEYNISYQESIERAAVLANQHLQQYIALEPFAISFNTETDAKVKTFLRGLRYIIRGFCDWHHLSGRYPRYEYTEDEF